MSDSKRKTALLILAKAKPSGDAPADDVDSEGEDAAAEDILKAVKADDASALKEALANWHDIACGNDSGE